MGSLRACACALAGLRRCIVLGADQCVRLCVKLWNFDEPILQWPSAICVWRRVLSCLVGAGYTSAKLLLT